MCITTMTSYYIIMHHNCHVASLLITSLHHIASHYMCCIILHHTASHFIIIIHHISSYDITCFLLQSHISSICWHPAGGLVFVSSLRGEVQCLDIALNPLQFLVVSEDLHGTPLLELGSYCM